MIRCRIWRALVRSHFYYPRRVSIGVLYIIQIKANKILTRVQRVQTYVHLDKLILNESRSRFLFRRPPLSYVSNLFTLPFERSVWIAIGILLVIVIGLLYLAMKWEYTMRSKEEIPQRNWTDGNANAEPTFSDDLLVVMGAVSQQGDEQLHSL